MKPSAKRQLLMDTAFSLFDRYGFTATGVDLIIKQSGASKATLYKYFNSKEELILDVLNYKHEANMKAFNEAIEKKSSYAEPVLGIFDVFHDWFQQDNYYGCCINKAANEFNDNESLISKFISQTKIEMIQLLINHLEHVSRSHAQANELAHSLLMLIDGAIIDAHICQNKNAALKAKNIASFLIKGNDC